MLRQVNHGQRFGESLLSLARPCDRWRLRLQDGEKKVLGVRERGVLGHLYRQVYSTWAYSKYGSTD